MSKTREFMRRQQLIAALVDVAPGVLMRCVDVWPRACIPASIAGAAALRMFGVDAKPVFVSGSAIITSTQQCVDFGGRDGLHVVITVGSKTLVDLTAGQFGETLGLVLTPPSYAVAGRVVRFADVIVAYDRVQRPRDQHLLSESTATRALAEVLYEAMGTSQTNSQ